MSEHDEHELYEVGEPIQDEGDTVYPVENTETGAVVSYEDTKEEAEDFAELLNDVAEEYDTGGKEHHGETQS